MVTSISQTTTTQLTPIVASKVEKAIETTNVVATTTIGKMKIVIVLLRITKGIRIRRLNSVWVT